MTCRKSSDKRIANIFGGLLFLLIVYMVSAEPVRAADHQTRNLDQQQCATCPVPEIPRWGLAEITASHVIHTPLSELPDKPQQGTDPLNLYAIAEAGDHYVTILDGDSLELLSRIKSRFALHGDAQYSPDGRYVYLASRDGWVSKYDLHSFKPVAEIRVGVNTRNIAVSSDGKWVMAGNFLPHSLVVLHADDLRLYRVIEVSDGNGTTSPVSAVYDAKPRTSFVVALKDMKEIWELSYDPDAAPIYGNFVHSFRKGQVEGVVVDEQPFGVRRIKVIDYMDEFFFDPAYAEVIGFARNAKKALVYNLDARRRVGELNLSGKPHLGSSIVFEYEGRTVMATPHLSEAAVSVIDMENWETVKRIETLGTGFFMRSHVKTPYAWVGVFSGENRDVVQVIDKRTLEIVKTIRPEPGKTATHVEFTRDGRYIFVSVWDIDGALVIYDAATLEEIKRIPMHKPSGKY